MAIGAPVEIGFQNNTASASSVVITTAGAAAVGDTIILSICGNGPASVTSVVDSAGNTYAVAIQDQGTYIVGAIAFARVTAALPTVGTITVTFNASATRSTATAHKVSGLDAAPLDRTVTASPTGSSASATTAVTTQADEIVWGVVNSPSTVSFTGGGGTLVALTTHGASNGTTGSAFTYPMYRIVSATGTQSVGGTFGGSVRSVVNAATFKQGAALVKRNASLIDLTPGYRRWPQIV